MLMTSSTESAEPRKSIVGVVGSGKNRAKPVSKYAVDRNDDGGSRNGDRKFHPRLQYSSRATHLDAQDQFINGLIN